MKPGEEAEHLGGRFSIFCINWELTKLFLTTLTTCICHNYHFNFGCQDKKEPLTFVSLGPCCRTL